MPVAHEQDRSEPAELEEEVDRQVRGVRREVCQGHVGVDIGDGRRLSSLIHVTYTLHKSTSVMGAG